MTVHDALSFPPPRPERPVAGRPGACLADGTRRTELPGASGPSA